MSFHWSSTGYWFSRSCSLLLPLPLPPVAGPPSSQCARSVSGGQLLLWGLCGDRGTDPGWTHLLPVSFCPGHRPNHSKQRSGQEGQWVMRSLGGSTQWDVWLGLWQVLVTCLKNVDTKSLWYIFVGFFGLTSPSDVADVCPPKGSCSTLEL